jgi:hypothetical protein
MRNDRRRHEEQGQIQLAVAMVTTFRLTPPQALEPLARTYSPQTSSNIPQMGAIGHIIEAGQAKIPKLATARLIPAINMAEALPTPVGMIENLNQHIRLASWTTNGAPRNFPSASGVTQRNDMSRRANLSRRVPPDPIAGSHLRHVFSLTKTLARNIPRPPGMRDLRHSTMIRFILAMMNPDRTPTVE